MDDTLYDGTSLPPSSSDEVAVTPPPAAELPDGTLDEQFAWVSAGETQDERSGRANALWAAVRAPDGSNDSELAGRLQAAVYQQPTEPAAQPEQAAAAGAGVEPGGDGPSYEDAAASGPDTATVTEPETVAASPVPGEGEQLNTAVPAEAVEEPAPAAPVEQTPEQPTY